MTDTYTYTARHADDPDKVITFTLRGEYLEINLTGILENIGNIISDDERKQTLKEQFRSQAAPTVLKAMEELSGPIHVNDIKGDLIREGGNKLQIKIWKRIAGLRAAPINLNFGRVDNPDAAQAFLEELEDRKIQSEHQGKFFGPLDYWLGWLGLAAVLILLWRWPRRN